MRFPWLSVLLLLLVACGQSSDVGPDAGSTTPDVGVGSSVCEGLGLAACLGAEECAPRWDDACCPTCHPPGEPVACSDCRAAVYNGCRTWGLSCTLILADCGTTPNENCFGDVLDCSDARVGTLDTCDRFGCIPAYPSGMGSPDVERAICVPATADSCTVSCRRASPPCPTGTVPEGDGSCYTDRCIAAVVCE
ncbi:MAG: hypothetical protein H6721_26145 [Sandaracinus sp.]|nr:hypothetical protein [Sandaracinus sp.]MCB9622592.1 hypothetical protein [Sandaracinus sp.]MCB9635616.1 hypothetical protein [Sandaracinus sp.]